MLLDAQRDIGGDPDSEACIIDALTNLMHYCHVAGPIEFDYALRIARQHFTAEIGGE